MALLDCCICLPQSHVNCDCTRMCKRHRNDPASLRARAAEVIRATTRLRLLEMAEAQDVHLATRPVTTQHPTRKATP